MSITNSAIYVDPSTGALSTSAVQFRNRIINGDMRIDQRLAGASVTLSTPGDTYTADRWAAWFNTGGVYSVQRVTNATAPENAFALQATVTTSVNPTSSNGYYIHQKIEGFHVSDFGLGTSSASPFTISFWVRASITGAYSYVLRNDAKNRSYVTTYTINAVNTWEYKIITVPGDVTGTWLTNSSTGLDCIWGLGFGSLASTASSNTWLAGGFLGLTGSVQWISALGASFAITNVQVEKGQIATALEVRPYAMEFALCQRYYTRFDNNNSFCPLGMCNASSTSEVQGIISLPIPLRVSPTLQTSAGTGTITQGTTNTLTNDVYAFMGGNNYGFTTIQLNNVSPSSSVTVVSPRLTGGSGFVAGSSGLLYMPSTGGKFFALIAEL